MKCLGVIWASEADGLNQCFLLTFSPANIMKLSGFGFGLVVLTLYQYQDKYRQYHVQHAEFGK